MVGKAPIFNNRVVITYVRCPRKSKLKNLFYPKCEPKPVKTMHAVTTLVWLVVVSVFIMVQTGDCGTAFPA